MSEKSILPQYLFREGFCQFKLELHDLGILALLERYAGEKNFTYEDFLKEASTRESEGERLSQFEINGSVKRAVKENLLKIIKYKNSYQVEWLPNAFGPEE